MQLLKLGVYFMALKQCVSECFYHYRYRELGEKNIASWIKFESRTKSDNYRHYIYIHDQQSLMYVLVEEKTLLIIYSTDLKKLNYRS